MASLEPDDPPVRNEVSGSRVGHLTQIGAINRDLNIRYGADSPRMNKLAAIADDLADTIRESESMALAQLLGEVGDPQPANVTFDRLALIQWRDDGSGQQGDLDQISDYYRALQRGRLVVIGGPGSGKTVLAVHLVRQLLQARPATRDTPCPIPVRVGLSSFKPFSGDEEPRDVSDRELARRLDTWLVTQLVDRGVRRRHAGELLRKGWILPVLDGLDEMDVGTTPPRHAAAVIRALNTTGRRPVVLTSRRDRYEQLLRHTSDEPSLPKAHALQDATTVVIQPLAPAVVRDYLTYLFPDPMHPSGIVARWRATARALSNPARTDPLITALCSPWQLYLCRTAFADPESGDPYLLLAGLPSDELTNELMRRMIPAAVDHNPRPEGGHYTADQVTTWLTTLARHLHDTSRRGDSGTDILLHELWWAAGPRAPRYVGGAVVTLLVTMLTFLGFRISWNYAHWPLAAVFASLIVLTGYRVTRRSSELNMFDLGSLATRRGRQVFVAAFTVAAVLGLVLGYAVALAGWFALGPVVGPVLGFGCTVVVALGQTPSKISTPRDLVHKGLIHDVGAAVAIGGAILTPAAVLAILPGVGVLPAKTVMAVLTFGLALGLGLSATRGPSPWPRYLVAVLLLRYRKALPLRPARFLDWAYTSGLVRLSGLAIQFRHDTFRAWLIQHDDLRPADPAEPRRSLPPAH